MDKQQSHLLVSRAHFLNTAWSRLFVQGIFILKKFRIFQTGSYNNIYATYGCGTNQCSVSWIQHDSL